MNAEIVAIGTELLMGQIVNSDAQYLSRRLASLGISVYYHTTVGDNPARMRETLSLALSRSDMVITTGGLGPTQDDLSKEIVAELLGLPMRHDEKSWRAILAWHRKAHRLCPENNMKQAMFAEGATVLPNACGTAPGCMIEHAGKLVVQLPGPPGELADMFEREVAPRLAARMEGCILSRYVRIYGMGEAAVARRCEEFIEGKGDVTVAPYCGVGECMLRVTARGRDETEALNKVSPVVSAICQRLGDVVYAVTPTSDGGLAEAVAKQVLEQDLIVSTAESCTGGLIASKLVATPGISRSLDEAHVVYAEEAKILTCGVDPLILRRHGAVSEETACALADGLRSHCGADIVVATTGIAGPGGGTRTKPVGLVYVAVASELGVRAEKLMLTGDRQRIRELASLKALDMLRRTATEYKVLGTVTRKMIRAQAEAEERASEYLLQ